MPRALFKPVLGVERPSNYFVSETIRSDFPQEVRYDVSVSLDGRRMLCRCGEPVWTLFRDNEEFVCECSSCGSEMSFGMLCFSLFDVAKTEGSGVVDLPDAEVCDD